jgi:hypothetical protein
MVLAVQDICATSFKYKDITFPGLFQIAFFFRSPQNVWVVKLVHELHLLEHVGPVRAVLVHLKHHHLARRLVGHLKRERETIITKTSITLEEKICRLRKGSPASEQVRLICLNS